jgi:hypothetical protein
MLSRFERVLPDAKRAGKPPDRLDTMGGPFGGRFCFDRMSELRQRASSVWRVSETCFAQGGRASNLLKEMTDDI